MVTVSETREGRQIPFFAHLEELRARLKLVFAALLVSFVAFLALTLRFVVVAGVPMWLPVPTLSAQESIASQTFVALRNWLVPPSVTTIVLTPWDGILVQFKVAFFLAAVAISPVSTYEFWKFVAPALRPSERRMLVSMSVPVVVLFLAGVLMSLLIVLPFTFPFLYGIAAGIGATPLLQVQDFLDFVLLFSLAFGLAFELPVIMYGLSRLGIVDADFWRRNWRFAGVAIFFFGAIITPDGSGVTMILVAVPMLLLYAGGYAAVRIRFRPRTNGKSS